ncbi:MAG TPA: hypothetical protein VN729_10410 [Ktedonobacteraceae bacterium]|nr:hypothetical protein [Ktedonobacteraceae bacterium]
MERFQSRACGALTVFVVRMGVGAARTHPHHKDKEGLQAGQS